MIVGLKGVIISISSMIGIITIALLHNYGIINLSVYIKIPLILFSFIITLLGIIHMCGEFINKEKLE